MQPQAPTQPDLATLGIAVAGLVVALVSLYLTLRRDRAAGRVGVRLTVEQETVAEGSGRMLVRLANPERRTVTVERVGLSRSRSKEIRATKRRTQGPLDEYGQPTSVEIEDDVVVDSADAAAPSGSPSRSRAATRAVSTRAPASANARDRAAVRSWRCTRPSLRQPRPAG